MEKLTFAQKVMAFLKGGDEAKIARFETKLTKFYSKQIAMRKDQIETFQDKKKDAQESLTDGITSVDLDKIQNTDSLEAYVKEYHNKIQRLSDEVNEFDEKIDNLQEEIKKLEATQTLIFNS